MFDCDERLAATVDYLKNENIPMLYPGHCISFQAKTKMNTALKVHDVGVGLTIELK